MSLAVALEWMSKQQIADLVLPRQSGLFQNYTVTCFFSIDFIFGYVFYHEVNIYLIEHFESPLFT